MKFSQIPYKRVDMEDLKTRVQALIQRFVQASSFDEARGIFLEMEELGGSTLSTMSTLAHIRRDIDTRDPFYDEEVNFYDREVPLMEPLMNQWTKALLDSPFRPQMEKEFSQVYFINAQMELDSFAPELVEDMQRENQLTSKYTKLIASAQISFQGQTLTISQLTPYKLSADDEVRRAAWQAEGQWYNAQGKELDEIYDELVKLRHAMGKKLGHDTYIPLGYLQMKRNSYTVRDVEAFRAAVRKYVVPVAEKLYQRQAQRLGFEYPMSFADKGLEFRSGNPKPQGTPQDILNMGDTFYSQLSPETKEFWEHMRSHELMDVLSRPGKAGGGYCTGIYSIKSPFIFANFNGTAHDVEVITHEAGHAFAGYVNRHRIPVDIQWPSLEGCEVHSMSMEFFAEKWADGFFGPDARKFLYTHVAGSLTFIPYGTLVDHFQHEVYLHPDYTPQQRHDLWRELTQVYMPWVKMDDLPFYGEGKGWQRQMHIYRRPFYYIDYCLAQTVALQFWARIQKDLPAAFHTYMAYTRLGGSLVFTDLLKEAGLDSPFEEKCLRDICAQAGTFLMDYDLTGID